MPFGLKNAPATFQNLMKEVLGTYCRKFTIAYLDNIIIYSGNIQDHLLHLALIFEKLDFYGLSCNPKKCYFGRTSIDYLGHIVTSTGNQAQPEHVHAIQGAKPPRTRKELRSFLGTCGWLREYVPNFAEIAVGLTDLLNPKTPYRWNADSQTSFEGVVKLMEHPPSLDSPDPKLPFILQTDASARGMYAVLMQEGPDKRQRIIAYASAKFTPKEA